jgi:predicted ArsR family transcriptional regulator
MGKDGGSMIELLREMGFEPEVRKEKEIQLVVSKNCPILQVSMKYPELVCDTFHTIFLKRLEGDPDVVLRQAISRGAKQCIHEVHPKIG